MGLAVLTCNCGSTDQLARQFLAKAGYPEPMSMPIEKGKERSLSALTYIPQTDETEMLANYLKNASKWVVILGYDFDSKEVLWEDIAHNAPASTIRAEFIVKRFA